MGLLKSMHRRTWKSALGNHYEIHLRTIADIIGPATLDDLLNDQYDCAARTPAVAAVNLARVLNRSFGINIPLLAMRSKISSLDWDREAS